MRLFYKLNQVSVALFFHILFRNEPKRRAVDAVAQTSKLFRPVIENMAEMGVADAAAHFDTVHAVRRVAVIGDNRRVNGPRKTRPSAAGVELGIGPEQWRVAAYASIDAVFVVIPEFAGKGPFGGGVARDLVLHWIELGAPFGVGFRDFIAHGLFLA